MDLSSFSNTRARLQRVKDARFYAGWVALLSYGEVRMRVIEKHDLEPGQVMRVECFGLEQTAFFEAPVLMSADKVVVLGTPDNLRFGGPQEAPRIWRTSALGTFKVLDTEHKLSVQDISATGVGAFVTTELSKGATGVLNLQTQVGPLNCEAEICYSRKVNPESELYRIGLRLDFKDRISRALWIRWLKEDAAA